MTPDIEALNRLATAWLGLAWAVVWQSSLLIGVFALVALGMRRSSPSLRYWFWQIAAIKLLVMPLWSVSIVLPTAPPRGTGARLDSWPAARSGGEIGLRQEDRRLRRDLLWDWIPATARLLYFFHPAAHFIVARARLERELACDQTAMVLAGLGAAGYASTLVEIVSRSSAPPALRAALAPAGLDGAAPIPAGCAGIETTPS